MNTLPYNMYLRSLLYGHIPIFYNSLTQPPIKPTTPPITEPITTASESTSTSSNHNTTPLMYRSFFSNTLLPPKSHTDRTIVHTSKLQTPKQIEYYKAKGLKWLRRHDTQSYPAILRNPTMGCNVEILSKPNLYTVHIDSPQAKKIICRLCYF